VSVSTLQELVSSLKRIRSSINDHAIGTGPGLTLVLESDDMREIKDEYQSIQNPFIRRQSRD